MGRKSTAEDVAREAGVSASTVDRVLNNRGDVGKAKERLVFAAARRLRLDRALDARGGFRAAPSNPYHAALTAAIHGANHGPNPFNIQTRIFHADPVRPADTARKVHSAGADHDAVLICVAHDG